MPHCLSLKFYLILRIFGNNLQRLRNMKLDWWKTRENRIQWVRFISKEEDLQQRERQSERQAVVVLSSLQSPVEHRAEESCISGGNWECETCQIREAIWGPADKLKGFNHGKKHALRQAHIHTNINVHVDTRTSAKPIQILNHLLHSTANKSAT